MCFPPGLFQGVAGKGGGGVLGIVSPALLDDRDPPATSPSVNGSKPVWNILPSISRNCRRIGLPMLPLHRFGDLSRW